MGLWESIKNRINKVELIGYEYPIDDHTKRVYLKQTSIDKVVNYVARTMSTAKFIIKTPDGKGNDFTHDWEYKLNVRPNRNQNATEFWQKVFYKLLFDNEVLIIMSDDDQVLIADSFVKDDSISLYDYRFTDVVVGKYPYKRPFIRSEVLYLKYGNEQLSKMIDGLFEDYADLFNSLLKSVWRNGQIRGSVSINKTGTFADAKERTEQVQSYLNNMFKIFDTKETAYVMTPNGMDIEEFSNKGNSSNIPFSDLNSARYAMTAEVAELVGIPSNLVFGDKLELDQNKKLYKENVVNPLIKMLTDEMNGLMISQSDYQKGLRLTISNVLTTDVFELSTQIDKLVASGVFSPNDILEELGRDKVDDPMMDKHYITKNYTEYQDNERGEEISEEN